MEKNLQEYIDNNDLLIPKYTLVKETKNELVTLVAADDEESYKLLLDIYYKNIEKYKNSFEQEVTLTVMNMETYTVIKRFNNYENA